MNKFKIILTASIAAVLTLSCSNTNENRDDSSSSNGNSSCSSSVNESSSSDQSGNVGGESSSSNVVASSSSSINISNSGDGSGSFVITEVYKLLNKTDNQFTYLIEDVYDHCTEGGIFKSEEDNWDHTINYSINNKTMIWKSEWSDSNNDTLNFKGLSNELIGTWTRTKNIAISCSDEYKYGSLDCKNDWETTKVVFTGTTVEITRDICYTDTHVIDGEDEGNGWKWRVVDCNTAEVYKGAEKITQKVTINDITFSYNSKSCTYEFDPPKSKKEAACREAWNEYQNEEYWDNYYYDILDGYFEDCLKSLVPPELGGNEPAAKIAAKTKITPLLKKKNQRYSFF